MKKVWLCLLTAVLIIPILCCGTNAEEYADPRDSRYISPKFLAEITVDRTTEVIIKAYNYSLLVDFSECDNIEEILERRNSPRWTVYIEKTTAGLLYYEPALIENYEKLHMISSTKVKYSSGVVQEFQTMEAISAVSPDVIIESVYFFYGSACFEGCAVYYKTNLGDYVYYQGFGDGVEMLCTAERFFEYKKAEAEAMRVEDPDEYLDGGGAGISNWDLSVYDYRSPKFNPAAPLPNSKGEQLKLFAGIAIAILLPAAAVTVYMTKRKKQVQESTEL